MTITVGAFEAKTKFSELLDKVEAGEVVIVTRRGKEVARIAGRAHIGETGRSDDDRARLQGLRELSEKSRRARLAEGIAATSNDHDRLFYDDSGLPK